MKKLFATLAILFLLVPTTFAASLSADLTFAWEDSNDKSPESGFAGWKMYTADTQDGTYIPLLDSGGAQVVIPYSQDNPGPTFIAVRPFVVEGIGGTTIRKWYKLTAFTETDESALSAEAAFYDFKIPLAAPFSLEVTARIRPQ